MKSNSNSLRIRAANNQDQEQIIEVIDKVYHEYGDSVFLQGADRDLLDIEQEYLAPGGAFWVLVDGEGAIKATHAAFSVDEAQRVCTFRRLYLSQELRGGEWGNQLMLVAIDWARDQNFARVEFWSDTRFARAHRFFEKHGFFDTGQRRNMVDGKIPYSERQFRLDLHAE